MGAYTRARHEEMGGRVKGVQHLQVRLQIHQQAWHPLSSHSPNPTTTTLSLHIP